MTLLISKEHTQTHTHTLTHAHTRTPTHVMAGSVLLMEYFTLAMMHGFWETQSHPQEQSIRDPLATYETVSKSHAPKRNLRLRARVCECVCMRTSICVSAGAYGWGEDECI